MKRQAAKRMLILVCSRYFGGIDGGRSRTRTYDPLIKSQLLYQLSYAPGPWSRRGSGKIKAALTGAAAAGYSKGIHLCR